MNKRELDELLARLVDRLVVALISERIGIREGTVMSLAGVAPYRRLDCDGRALCYVRRRPQKKAVRIDVSGLWRRQPSAKLGVQSSAGSATLMLTSEEDIEEVVAYLRSVVTATRQIAA